MNLWSTSWDIKAKCKLLLIFLAAISQSSFAQSNHKIDSLLNVLKTANKDTSEVKVLFSLSEQLRRIGRFEEAINFADSALILSRKLNFKKGIANAYYKIGSIYLIQYNYPEALKNFLEELKIREEIGDKKVIANCYLSIAEIYGNQGNHSEARKYYSVALQLSQETGNKSQIANVYNSTAIYYSTLGNDPEALENFLVSLKINEEIGNKEGVARAHFNIGQIYSNQGNYPEALKSALASLKIAEEIGHTYGIALGYDNIGRLFFHQGNYAEALENHFIALKSWEEIGDKNGIAGTYTNIGLVYIEQRKYRMALKNHETALKIWEETGNKAGIAKAHHNLGLASFHLCDDTEALKYYLASLEYEEETGNKAGIAISYLSIGTVYRRLHNYPEAKQYLNNCLTLSKEIGAKEVIKNTYYHLSKLDSVMGNYQQALEYHMLYAAYKDSLFNETKSQQIVQMKAQYESEKKDKDILQLTSEKQILEGEKQISVLLLKTKQDSLNVAQAQKVKVQLENLNVKLESEKVQALNLYSQQQIELLSNEKQLQQLQMEKDKADYAVQKAEADKEKTIQKLELNKQRNAKNYFIGGLFLFVILSIIVYKNYRTRQELRLQTLRNKIAIDLHDDIGSTLSSISIFSQMARAESKEVNPALETIGENSRKMLDAMADIVWTINPENDQFEKIIMRMRGFAFELLGARNIDFVFKADEDVSKLKLPMEARKNLYLIFKEATNNMVKYSEANKGMFTINEVNNKLTMTINDNGKGFDATQATQGNGLKNMKKRAIDIGAKLLIDSTPGSGTTIKLELAV